MNEYTREEGGEEVQDGEGVKRLVHNVESGDLCGDATTPSEMTACLLEGGTLLRSVSDATCAVNLGEGIWDCGLDDTGDL